MQKCLNINQLLIAYYSIRQSNYPKMKPGALDKENVLINMEETHLTVAVCNDHVP